MVRSGFWGPLFLSLLAFGIGIGAGLQHRQPYPDLARIAASDPRIEAVARAICVARGLDPDHQGPPFPQGPLWEYFILQSRDFIAAYDAAGKWPQRKPGRKGPP